MLPAKEYQNKKCVGCVRRKQCVQTFIRKKWVWYCHDCWWKECLRLDALAKKNAKVKKGRK